jgi:putative copper export protein
LRILQLASITVHLLAAAAWLGSMAFLAAVLVPALRGRAAAERRELLAETGLRLRGFVWPSFGLLIVTGVLQLYLRGYRWEDVTGTMWQGPAGHALAVKLSLFALALALAGYHDFGIGPAALALPPGDPRAESLRRRASILGRVVFLLALGIFAAAVTFVRGGLRP